MGKLKWDSEGTAASNAHEVLPDLADRYFQAGEKLIAGRRNARLLHRFVSKTERFGYTLELFRGSYGPGLDRRLEMLKPLQTLLGDISDCATAREMIKERFAKDSEQRTIALGFLKRRAKKKTGEFVEHWKSVFDKDGEREGWRDYLARYAGRGGN